MSGAGGLAIELRSGGDSLTYRGFYFVWWCSCFGLLHSCVVVVSFVISFVSSLTLGPGDGWAPSHAIGQMWGYLNKKKKTSWYLNIEQSYKMINISVTTQPSNIA